MHFFTFAILQGACGSVMFRDLAHLVTVLCLHNGTHALGVGRVTVGKGDFSTCHPHTFNLLQNRLD